MKPWWPICGSLKDATCLSLLQNPSVCSPVMPQTKEPQPAISMAIWFVVLQEQVLLGVVLWLVQGRELQLTDCQDKDGKDTNHLPEAQPPDHHCLRSDWVRFLFWGFCGGLGKRERKTKREIRFKICKGPWKSQKDADSRGDGGPQFIGPILKFIWTVANIRNHKANIFAVISWRPSFKESISWGQEGKSLKFCIPIFKRYF